MLFALKPERHGGHRESRFGCGQQSRRHTFEKPAARECDFIGHKAFSLRYRAVVMKACGTLAQALTSSGVHTTTSFAGNTPTSARRYRAARL